MLVKVHVEWLVHDFYKLKQLFWRELQQLKQLGGEQLSLYFLIFWKVHDVSLSLFDVHDDGGGLLLMQQHPPYQGQAQIVGWVIHYSQ